jgi:hypothetical protein
MMPTIRLRRDPLAGTGARCSWSDWNRVLERSWPGRVRTCAVGVMSSGELLSEAALIRHDLDREIENPHSGRRTLGRVEEEVGVLLARVFEDLGSLMAHEGYLMPRDLPPAAIATAPLDFQATIRRLAG